MDIRSILQASGAGCAALAMALAAVPATAQDNGQRGVADWQAWADRQAGKQNNAPEQRQDRGSNADDAARSREANDRQRAQDSRQRQDVQQQANRESWRDGQRGDGLRGRPQDSRQDWRGGDRADGNRREDWRGDGNRGNGWRNDRNHGDGWRNDGNRFTGSQQRWNDSWRRDRRYDWSGYRSANRDVYRFGRYRAPYNNWSYRRLGIGFSLQPLFYSSSYWIDDPYAYRLPPAYGPYRWVRYYDDALLVNIYTGQIEDVIHDIFW